MVVALRMLDCSSSPLLRYFMHCVSQVSNVPGCDTSDGNPSILGQIDREFFRESVNLRKRCNHIIVSIQQNITRKLLHK